MTPIFFSAIPVLFAVAVVVGAVGGGGRAVTRAKKDISAFMRGQGRVPLRPIPSFVVLLFASVPGTCPGAGRIGTVTGVVATINVSGRGRGRG